jgi:outer membrane protein assembly factor BamB
VRGNAPVVAGPGVLFVGNDDGTLSTLAMNDGRVLWQQTIGSPEGRSELDRMADVDAAPVLEGTTLFASSYKNETRPSRARPAVRCGRATTAASAAWASRRAW